MGECQRMEENIWELSGEFRRIKLKISENNEKISENDNWKYGKLTKKGKIEKNEENKYILKK